MISLALIGMPGSGKSAVARALGARSDSPVFDTDERFEAEFGPVSAYFDRFGEAAFRAKEDRIIRELCERPGIVSLGGGAVLNTEAMAALRATRPVVFLSAALSTLSNRLKGDDTRPLLREGEAALRRKYEERKDLYEAASDYALCVDEGSPSEIAQRILNLIRERK